MNKSEKDWLAQLATSGTPRFFNKDEATEYENQHGLQPESCFIERPGHQVNDSELAEQYGIPSSDNRSMSPGRKNTLALLATGSKQ